MMIDKIISDLNTGKKEFENAIFKELDKKKYSNTLRKNILYNLIDSGLPIRSYLFKLSLAYSNYPKKNLDFVGFAVELFHLSTLIVDDILDESELRNNKLTLYKKYGRNETIVIGHLLSDISYDMLCTAMEKSPIKETEMIKIMKSFIEAKKKVYLGQFLDQYYQRQSKIISQDEYINMIELTTASLIALPIELSNIISRNSSKISSQLKMYGKYLGLAIQIRDDMIDIVGQKQLIGKPLLGDIRQKKKRLPIIYALKKEKKEGKKYLSTLFNQKKLSETNLNDIIELLYYYGSIDHCKLLIRKYCDSAIRMIKRKDILAGKKLIFIAETITKASID